VEAKQYQDFFEPQLSAAGYGSVFKPKSRARTMNEWTNVDGCAIFYLREKYNVVVICLAMHWANH
jgi:CCR4-NOT transcription complex subunit 6